MNTVMTNTDIITTLIRRFKLGATILNDPAPDLPPEEALRLFIPNYPFLASARLGEPTVEGDVLLFPVEKPEVQTKGASEKATKRDIDAVMKALETWEHQPAPTVATSRAWAEAGRFANVVLSRDPTPLDDALAIPLA